MKTCMNCQSLVEVDMQFCEVCGIAIWGFEPNRQQDSPRQKTCPTCQSVVEAAAQFCDVCGIFLLNKEQPEKSSRRKKNICPRCHNPVQTTAVICEECRKSTGDSRRKMNRIKTALFRCGIAAVLVASIIFVFVR